MGLVILTRVGYGLTLKYKTRMEVNTLAYLFGVTATKKKVLYH